MITGLTGMCGIFFIAQNPNGRLNEPTTSTNGSESQCEFKEIHLLGGTVRCLLATCPKR